MKDHRESLFKDPSFAYEEEFRVVYHCGVFSDEIEHRIARGIIVPYIKLPVMGGTSDQENRRTVSAIEGIAIGPTGQYDLARAGIIHMLSHSKYDPIPIVSSKSSLRF